VIAILRAQLISPAEAQMIGSRQLYALRVAIPAQQGVPYIDRSKLVHQYAFRPPNSTSPTASARLTARTIEPGKREAMAEIFCRSGTRLCPASRCPSSTR